ncbi:hypothetical protein V6W59_03075 [Mannheimia sp. HC-2023]|uniref:hypothetical protein n=1 Tax=Mannheimia indoligenes TaxID=3103145 RepID=UPI002FE6C14E
MKKHLNLKNVPLGTKCKLRNGNTAVILAVLENPLMESEAVVGYKQFKDGEYQTPFNWSIDGFWNDRDNPECREWDIVKITS